VADASYRDETRVPPVIIICIPGSKKWYGCTVSGRVTSSSFFRSGSGSSKESAARLSSSCAGFVAPRMVEVTPGRRATQFSATWAGGRPISFATDTSTSTICQFR